MAWNKKILEISKPILAKMAVMLMSHTVLTNYELYVEYFQWLCTIFLPVLIMNANHEDVGFISN